MLGLPLSCDLLLHGSEETLTVEETCHPEGWWSLLADPAVKLVMSIKESLDPTSEGWRQPGDLGSSWIVLPLVWHSEIVDSVDTIDNFGGHDDGSFDGINHVDHGVSHNRQDLLESLELLGQENVKWNGIHLSWLSKSSWSLQDLESLHDLNWHEVIWELW